VPSIAALNPEIEPELESIVRKSLARDPDERYVSAADLGDALTQYLFSRRMKVTARDIAGLVRDTQLELMRKRSAEPKESIIDALINDEVAKLTSLVGDEEDDGGNGAAGRQTMAAGSVSLDPGEFINTEGWVTELHADVPSSQIPRVDVAKQMAQQRAQQTARQKQQRPTQPPPKPRAASADDDLSLSQILEPDKTGVHRNDSGGGRGLLIVIALLLVVGAGVAVGLFLFGT
jgi:serine/threonine-protein kinase